MSATHPNNVFQVGDIVEIREDIANTGYFSEDNLKNWEKDYGWKRKTPYRVSEVSSQGTDIKIVPVTPNNNGKHHSELWASNCIFVFEDKFIKEKLSKIFG